MFCHKRVSDYSGKMKIKMCRNLFFFPVWILTATQRIFRLHFTLLICRSDVHSFKYCEMQCAVYMHMGWVYQKMCLNYNDYCDVCNKIKIRKSLMHNGHSNLCGWFFFSFSLSFPLCLSHRICSIQYSFTYISRKKYFF